MIKLFAQRTLCGFKSNLLCGMKRATLAIHSSDHLLHPGMLSLLIRYIFSFFLIVAGESYLIWVSLFAYSVIICSVLLYLMIISQNPIHNTQLKFKCLVLIPLHIIHKFFITSLLLNGYLTCISIEFFYDYTLCSPIFKLTITLKLQFF